MKKALSVILIFVMLLGLAACGGTGAQSQENAGLQAGFGRVDISPMTPVGLDGYGDDETRLSTTVLDPIYATCVALRQGETTFLVLTIDALSITDGDSNALRSSISGQTGITKEHIFFGATHTHSAPAWNGSTSAGCLSAAKEAIADLAPATMEAASTQLESMNFVRHYLMNDGTYYGSNFGSEESGYKQHVMDPDKQLSLVKLERGDKKDILMVNWQAHPASAARQSDYTGVSADFVGYARKKVELEAGVLMAYYTGAAGNTNRTSHISGLSPAENSNYQSYGANLGSKIVEAMALLQPVENTEMKATNSKFQVEIDHSWDHMAAEASKAVSAWAQQGLEAGHKLAREYGFSSVYHASAVTKRGYYKGNQYKDLYAFSVGPIGFVTNTYEMFSDHALYVKEKSPFDITFIITGCNGYIANEAAYEYRSYESDTSPYVKGTGEKLAEEMARLLNELK